MYLIADKNINLVSRKQVRAADRETDKEGETEAERQTERQTERDRQRQRDRQSDKQRERETEAERQTLRNSYLNVELKPKLTLPESGANSELTARSSPGSKTFFIDKDFSKTRSLVYRSFKSWP